jgi:protein gp37
MGSDSGIGWTDDTVNAWWGCTKVSPACSNCYAEGFARRTGKDVWGPSADRLIRVDAAIRELHKIAARGDREGRPRRVFMHSMSDIFEDRADLLDPRARAFDALHAINKDRVRLIPMLVSKRAEFMAFEIARLGLPNGAWVGCTVEDQQRADERIPYLLRVPAAVRFLSVEPMLGAVDLRNFKHRSPTEVGWFNALTGNGGNYLHRPDTAHAFADCDYNTRRPSLNWIIAGCESSGPRLGKRPTDPAWLRSLRDQCVAAGVPYFLKQADVGGALVHAPELDGRAWQEIPEVPS